MQNLYSIQLKAAFLLVVFSLNTIMGFACAIGIDMGFNHDHYEQATTILVHVHANGKKHVHEDKVLHDHNNKPGHHHQDSADMHHAAKKNAKDDCCNDKVIKLAQDDKAFSSSLNFTINPVFFTSFISSFSNVNLLSALQVNQHTKYFVRSHHPPIPDIRIAIQSFQI